MDLDKIVIAAIALPVILIFTYVYWKKTIVFILYWTLMVGAIRKWFFPQLADIALFTTHIFLVGPYLRLLTFKLTSAGKYSFLLFLVALLTAWGVLSLFNPKLPNIRVGILGLVMHFYYIPLAFLGSRLYSSSAQLLIFLKRYAFFSAPLFLLGIFQYFSPVDSSINKYVEESAHIAMVAGHARITSTFSYISGYTTYLNVIVLLLFYLLSAQRVSPSEKLKATILILLAGINLFMTGSRGTVVLSILSVIAYLIASVRLGLTFVTKLVFRIALLGSIALAILTFSQAAKKTYKESVDSFMTRVEDSRDEISGRLIDTFTPFKFLKEAGLFGYGIGTTYQGAAKFDVDWKKMPRDFEEEPERIVLEMGFIGYLLVYFLRLYILFLFWGLFLKLKSTDLKLLALTILLFQVQFLQLNNLVFNLTSGIFYWFFTGFLFLLPKLDRSKVVLKTSQNPNLPSR